MANYQNQKQDDQQIINNEAEIQNSDSKQQKKELFNLLSAQQPQRKLTNQFTSKTKIQDSLDQRAITQTGFNFMPRSASSKQMEINKNNKLLPAFLNVAPRQSQLKLQAISKLRQRIVSLDKVKQNSKQLNSKLILKSDNLIQVTVLQDLLKLIAEKAYTLKIYFNRPKQINPVFCNISSVQQTITNKKIEKLLCYFHEITNLLINVIPDQALLTKFTNQKKFFSKHEFSTNEFQTFALNSKLFVSEYELFQNVVDYFNSLQKYQSRNLLDEPSSQQLLLLGNEAKFLEIKLLEEIRVHKKHEEDAKLAGDALLTLQSPAHTLIKQNKSQNMMNVKIKTEEEEPLSPEMLKKKEKDYNLLLEITRKKHSNDQAQDIEFANNKKALAIKRLKNPFNVPEVRLGIKIARDIFS